MKKYIGILIMIVFALILWGVPVKAASFGMSSSKRQVKPNESFTVSVGGQCIGRVNISVSNGTASTSSVWVEENYVPVTIRAGGSGSVTITATPTVGFSNPDGDEYSPGARSTTVTIYQKPTSSTTQKPTTNNNKPTTNTNTSTSKPNQEEKKKSSNNMLSSLTIENSNLSPKFDKNVSKYEVNLPANTDKIKISAKAEHAKAKVEGTGEISLKQRR
ncbi:MAG: cadherin-like beta sandwich domain-containing protein [Clostridia bacterium]|jgi:hypothetical protein|nr:cadherin-like beta sandwich domain-containing protein [Clostridia bacterium]MCI9413378.1 cadherin-like beta sandwich domain-containing protein [Clostridia bacterium]